jgi:hypothetical protein
VVDERRRACVRWQLQYCVLCARLKHRPGCDLPDCVDTCRCAVKQQIALPCVVRPVLLPPFLRTPCSQGSSRDSSAPRRPQRSSSSSSRWGSRHTVRPASRSARRPQFQQAHAGHDSQVPPARVRLPARRGSAASRLSSSSGGSRRRSAQPCSERGGRSGGGCCCQQRQPRGAAGAAAAGLTPRGLAARSRVPGA